jgi:hypothetical protein
MHGWNETKQNLKHVLEIGKTASYSKIKLEARSIANDCYQYIINLCTNAGMVNDALKFATQKQEQINTLQQQQTDESIITETEEAIEEEETTTTTNGVI